MKKIPALTLALLLCFTVVRAQFATIPDANFRNFLKTSFPACFNASDKMDTTCAAVLSQTSLNCNSLGIQDLGGIQYFKTLKTLNCRNNQLSFVPSLPPDLVFLNCRDNQVSSFAPLPAKLDYFNCAHNNLAVLPALPATLTSLQCFHNHISALPTVLPAGLQVLVCAFNPIQNLPLLPSSLIELNFDVTTVSSLPTLPTGLQYFFCDSTRIVSLPVLPGSLLALGCGFNGFKCLPRLPLTLRELYIDSASAISCLPNGVSGLTVYAIRSFEDGSPAVRNLPVCTAGNNTNGCTIFKNWVDFCPPVSSGTISSNINGASYEWQADTCRSGNSCYYSLIGQNGYANAGTATLSIVNMPSQKSGIRYRCLVDGKYSAEFVLRFTSTWAGSLNDLWENPANWNCNYVPDEYTDVFISSGNAVINANVTINSLQMSSQANLKVNAGNNLVVKSRN